jgi:hypothetical protein
MKLVVVGGHSRNIGKTAVAAGVINATRELAWTALKLTQYGHNLCSEDGRACDCAPENPDHPFAISREQDPGARTDTSRFLAAGAAEAWWVRTPQGRLAEAMPAVRRIIDGKPYVILESNSVLRFLRPDLYLMVLDWDNADFKPSALANLDRADAFVQLETARSEPAWPQAPLSVIRRRPVFRVRPPQYFSEALAAFVRERLLTSQCKT